MMMMKDLMTKKRFETSFRPHIFVNFVFIFFVFVCFFWLYIIVLRLCGSIRVDTERSETWDLRVRKTYTKRVKKERALIGTQFCDFCVSSSVCCVT